MPAIRLWARCSHVRAIVLLAICVAPPFAASAGATAMTGKRKRAPSAAPKQAEQELRMNGRCGPRSGEQLRGGRSAFSTLMDVMWPLSLSFELYLPSTPTKCRQIAWISGGNPALLNHRPDPTPVFFSRGNLARWQRERLLGSKKLNQRTHALQRLRTLNTELYNLNTET